MKIVYVVTRSDSVGGAQYHVRDLAVGMRIKGHHPHVLVGGNGPFFDLLESSGISYTKVASLVRPLSPKNDIACVFELRKLFRQLKPDLVHSHSSKAGIVARLAAKTMGIRNLFSAHGWSFTEGIDPRAAARYQVIERWASRWCNRILLGCERDRQLGLHKRIGNDQLLQTIWYGLPDIEPLRLSDPRIEPPKLVMVARFEEQKDHKTLLDALAKLRDLDWSIDLVGDGPLRPSMEERAAELGLSDRTRFLGVRPTGDILLASQIFPLITNWEGLPLSVLEAMRVGLPIIGSGVGGIPEQVLEGESGFVVSPGDSNQLAGKLRTLILDRELRAKMGIVSRQRFVECFQASSMLDKIESVYHQVAR